MSSPSCRTGAQNSIEVEMLSLFVSGAADVSWLTRQFSEKWITTYFGKRQYSWSHVRGRHINILMVLLGVLCPIEYTYNNKRKEKWRGEVDMIGPVSWAKRQILAVKNTFVHCQNTPITPTTAQWSLFSANSNSLHKCLGIRHTIQYTKSPLSFEKGSPKVYKALTTNKLNWFSASNASLS